MSKEQKICNKWKEIFSIVIINKIKFDNDTLKFNGTKLQVNLICLSSMPKILKKLVQFLIRFRLFFHHTSILELNRRS